MYHQRVSFLLSNVDVGSIRVQITDALCYILVLIGLVGNLLGLLIFSSSRHTRRVSSVYVYLATCSSIINLFCVIRYASTLHSKSQYWLRELVGHVWLACKVYEFSSSFRIVSSWITLFWMFERVTCVSKRLQSIFYRWNKSSLKFVIPLMIITIVLGCVMGPSLYMYQPQQFDHALMNFTTNPIHQHCAPDPKVSIRWQKYFSDTHLAFNHHTIRCFFSELIPAAMIIFFNSYIMFRLVRTSRYFIQTDTKKTLKERRQTTSWMNIVLILHSSLFLFSLLSHIAGHFMSIDAHETCWVLLAVLSNCSLNFYIYCLSGEAFRQKTRRFLQHSSIQFFYLIKNRKQQWKFWEDKSNHRDLFNKSNHLGKMNRRPIYQSYEYPKNLGVNSPFRLDQEQTPV